MLDIIIVTVSKSVVKIYTNLSIMLDQLESIINTIKQKAQNINNLVSNCIRKIIPLYPTTKILIMK
jgi:DNA anti-recombination protein RmuC